MKFSFFVYLLLAFVIFSFIRTRYYIDVGREIAKNAVAYEQFPETPDRYILIMGDSSAVGTGADSPMHSVAGYLGQDYPNARIENKAVNGLRMTGLLGQMRALQGDYDLLLIHIGGNDIIRFTQLGKLRRDLKEILNLAEAHADKVIVLHGGNMGSSRFFPFGSRWLFTHRTLQVRAIYLDLFTSDDFIYVDMFRERKDDPFASDPKKYYSADLLHPSAEGYKDWYLLIKKFLP